METQDFSDTFSLFHNLDTETLEWLLSMTESESYNTSGVIISEDNWGKAIYLIVSGWVKLENIYQHQDNVTLEIIGRGGLVGEAGILESVNTNSRVTSISDVELLSISAQRFLQILYRDAQIQNRLLKMMVKKVSDYQKYCQFHRQTGKVKLTTVFLSLADKYGKTTENGIQLFNFSRQDLADLAQLTSEECEQIMNKLESKGLLLIDQCTDSLFLTNIKQLHHIIGKLGND